MVALFTYYNIESGMLVVINTGVPDAVEEGFSRKMRDNRKKPVQRLGENHVGKNYRC